MHCGLLEEERCVGYNFALGQRLALWVRGLRSGSSRLRCESPLISSSRHGELVRIVDSMVIIRDWIHSKS